MSRNKLRFLFNKKRLFQLIIPVGIIVFVFSVFAFTNSSKADSELTDKLAGKVLLQTENNGQAWYLDPDSKSRLFLGRPDDAYKIMNDLGLGIKVEELATYINSSFPKRLSGKILLSVEEHGEAYYINPDDLQGYYLGIPQDALNIMRELSLGINNEDIEKIEVYKDNNEEQGSSSGSSSGNTNSENSNINDGHDDSSDNEENQEELTDNQEQKQETKLSIETLSPKPVFKFSNIMTVYASLGDGSDVDNIKEWGIVWGYNNIPGVEITPTLEDNRYRVSGDINQIQEKQEKLSLDIVGLAPSTFPYIRSYLILEDNSVIYGNTQALYKYNQEEKEGLDGGDANGETSSSFPNNSGLTQGMPSLPTVSVPVYQASYQSGANGSLSGKTSQSVTLGKDTNSVTAIPDANYEFVRWSDGVTNNPRVDTSVKSNIDVVAEFRLLECGDHTVTFDYNNSSVTYGTVENATTTECWLDRNLGATQVAATSTDSLAYGDLFQWGRGDDGHQERTSATSSTLSTLDDPGHSNFITPTDSPLDWRDGQNDNLWQGVDGINNPCPTGYRLPVDTELTAEMNSWSSSDSSGAFNSPLKWSMAGGRVFHGSLGDGVGSVGRVWGSSVSESRSSLLSFDSSGAGFNSFPRANGFSVRCLRD